MSSIRQLATRTRPQTLFGAAIVAIALLLRFLRLEAYPPGVQHDEVFVTNFAQTILHGQYPIFFELNRGNEPLFMYFLAAAFKIFGANVWALRGTAALVGSIAMLLTYLLAREMFALPPMPPSHTGREVGAEGDSLIPLFTVGGLAFSFWLLYESRVGLHTISTYLLAVATFYSFWRGWTRAQRAWLLASGIFAGL